MLLNLQSATERLPKHRHVIQRSVLGVQLKWAGVESDTKNCSGCTGTGHPFAFE